MIYRGWSLLTGPGVVIGGVVAGIAAVNFLLMKDDSFNKTGAKKQELATSSK